MKCTDKIPVEKIDHEEVRYTLEILSVITRRIINKLATRLDERQYRSRLKKLSGEIHRLKTGTEQLIKFEDYLRQDAAFWGSLAEIAGNPVLADSRLYLQNMLSNLVVAGLNPDVNHNKLNMRNEGIITALLANDAKAAIRLMQVSEREVWGALF